MATKKAVLNIPEGDPNREVYEFEMKDRSEIDLCAYGEADAKDSDIIDSMTKDINNNKEQRKTLFYETGCVPFDLAMTNGRGLPIGSSLLFYASPGTGKTTLLADVLFRILAKHKQAGVPYKVLYLDLEGSKELLLKMGLGQFMDDGSLLYRGGALNFRELDAVYGAIFKNKGIFKGVNLVVIDSINTVASVKTQTKECGAAEFGNDARARKDFYMKYLPNCEKIGLTNWFIAQVRTNQGAGMFEDDKKPAVTQFDLHYVDIVSKLDSIDGAKSKETSKRTVKTTTGEDGEQADMYLLTIQTAKMPSNKLLKNRYGRYPKSSCLVEYGKRVSNAYTIRSMLKGIGLAKPGSRGCVVIDSELLDYIGLPDLKEVDIPESGKYGSTECNMGRFCRDNFIKIVEFLKSKGLYKLVIEQEQEEKYEI